jgi:ribulose-5-phosphate 4-epimerase/fuculose-1-phosphate aldolase
VPDGSSEEQLVVANRILVDQGILDAFGHVSVRCLDSADRFLISRNLAPGSVTAQDVQRVGLDGQPEDDRAPYLERFIHGEIYRARPDVHAVVHSHALSIIPFTVSKQPLRPVSHMAGFLGRGLPVFEIRDHAGPGSDLLIRDARLGRALAETVGDAHGALMRGHGIVHVAGSLPVVVMEAVYTERNAVAQRQAMAMGEVVYLDEAEAAAAAAANESQVQRAWDVWSSRIATP